MVSPLAPLSPFKGSINTPQMKNWIHTSRNRINTCWDTYQYFCEAHQTVAPKKSQRYQMSSDCSLGTYAVAVAVAVAVAKWFSPTKGYLPEVYPFP